MPFFRHPGPEPGSRWSSSRQEAGPRLKAGVTGWFAWMASGFGRCVADRHSFGGGAPAPWGAGRRALSPAFWAPDGMPFFRHPGLEPGSHWSSSRQEAGPRLEAGVTGCVAWMASGFGRCVADRHSFGGGASAAWGRAIARWARPSGIRALGHSYRHPGLEPGSRCSSSHQEAGPRLEAGVTGWLGLRSSGFGECVADRRRFGDGAPVAWGAGHCALGPRWDAFPIVTPALSRGPAGLRRARKRDPGSRPG